MSRCWVDFLSIPVLDPNQAMAPGGGRPGKTNRKMTDEDDEFGAIIQASCPRVRGMEK